MATRIAIDRYVYEDIYPSFKATTDEKAITENISRDFLNHLASRTLVLAGDAPIAVGDIGCGPCDTIVRYLTGVRFAPGFKIRATDYLPAYADAERGESLATLKAAQAKNTIRIADFSVRAGDAFAGKLLDLLGGRDDAMRSAFRIVYASHVMYHADTLAETRVTMHDIANNLLARDGVCILFHIANEPRTFQDFRARFGSHAGGGVASNTGAVSIDDPPTQIAAACRELRLPLHEGTFLSRLRFGKLGDDEWQLFADPRRYDQLANSNPDAYEDLKRLYFIVQRAPQEFAADNSATGLRAYLDQIRRVLEGHNGALLSSERMQVFTRSDAPAALSNGITEAIAASIAPAAR